MIKRNSGRTVLMLLALGLALSGCASLRGAPETVSETSGSPCPTDDDVVKGFAADDATRGGLSQVQWRETKISQCLERAQDNFTKFIAELHRDRVGIALGTDLAVLAASGVGTLGSEGTAKTMNAVVSGLSGARAAVDREAFFDQAMPALESAMQASRLEKLAIIRKNQAAHSTSIVGYSLADARTDLRAYEEAGSISSGLKQLSVAASAAENAQAKIVAAFQGSVMSDAVALRGEKMADYIRKLEAANDTATLTTIANGLAVPPQAGDSAAAIGARIRVEIARRATAGKLDEVYQVLAPVAPAEAGGFAL